MPKPYECLQTLLHIRHDHEFIDDRIRGLCSDNRRLGDPKVATRPDTLLGVPQCSPFHRPLHCSVATAGAYVELSQSELVSNRLAVIVFLAAYRMASPADDEIGFLIRMKDLRVSQNMEDRVRDALRCR